VAYQRSAETPAPAFSHLTMLVQQGIHYALHTSADRNNSSTIRLEFHLLQGQIRHLTRHASSSHLPDGRIFHPYNAASTLSITTSQPGTRASKTSRDRFTGTLLEPNRYGLAISQVTHSPTDRTKYKSKRARTLGVTSSDIFAGGASAVLRTRANSRPCEYP
jgi:hypothetical protein